jgi:hypothetical protein
MFLVTGLSCAALPLKMISNKKIFNSRFMMW